MNEPLVTTEGILDSLVDGVYVCDRERRIVYWSKSAERITGWAAADVLGRACLEDILSHVDKDGNRLCGKEHCPLHRAMVTGLTTAVPIIVFARGRDGRRIPMHVTAAPIRDPGGQVVGGVETFRDVTPIYQDLRRARQVQTQALALNLPEDSRLKVSAVYLPHDIVGGDFYAVARLDHDRYGFLLADLEGHGMAAALYTNQLSILWDRHCARLESPSAFAEAVNRDLVQIFGGVLTFAAAVCGTLDLATGVLRAVGAGGPSPVIVRSGGGVEALDLSGVMLGFVEDAVYTERTAGLRPGDRVLLFSDGAFEIHDAPGELLGVEGFLGTLGRLGYPNRPLDARELGMALLQYSNAIRLPDDLTVLELQLNG